MANLKCHQCGTEFSKTALNCRSCGAKTKRPSTAMEKFVLIGACAVFLVPMAFFVVSRWNDTPPQTAPSETAGPETPAPATAE